MSCKVQQSVCSDCVTYVKSRIKFNTFNTFNNVEKDWKKQLRHEASLHHMCGENRAALSEVKSKVEAVALYKKTVDWAIKEGYPDMETIRH